MRRTVCLGLLVLVAAASLAAANLGQAREHPQRPDGPLVPVPEIQKVTENLYVIPGGRFTGPGNSMDLATFNGGNTAVFVTGSGVVLVDTKFPGWGPLILEEVRKVTDKPVTMIINTHTHTDHTGSNAEFSPAVEIVVHENTKANLSKATCGYWENCESFRGEKAKYLPKRTFKDTLSIGNGRDRIDLHYFGVGHTNGDAWVVFPALRAVHTGDLFGTKGLPSVFAESGGSYVALPQTLQKGAAGVANVDTVIPGHSVVMKWSDLKEYAAFTQDFLAAIQDAVKTGKSLDEAARGVSALGGKYKGYAIDVNPDRLKAVVTQAYDEVKGTR